MPVAQELVASLDKLASLPTLYYRIRELLDDPDVSVNTLANEIAQDPALAAALLRMANSAFYGFPRKIETLTRAISLIGLGQVGEIVLASMLAGSFGGIHTQHMDMPRFWRGSVSRALLCRALAHQHGEREPERMFVIGLLSDLGHLVMYQAVPDLMGILLDMPAASLEARAEQERAIVGCDYTEVGAALTLSWRLPLSFGAIVGGQLSPPLAGEFAAEAALLNIAVHVAQCMGDGLPITGETIGCHEEAFELARLDPAILPVLMEQVQGQLEQVIGALALGSSTRH